MGSFIHPSAVPGLAPLSTGDDYDDDWVMPPPQPPRQYPELRIRDGAVTPQHQLAEPPLPRSPSLHPAHPARAIPSPRRAQQPPPPPQTRASNLDPVLQLAADLAARFRSLRLDEDALLELTATAGATTELAARIKQLDALATQVREARDAVALRIKRMSTIPSLSVSLAFAATGRLPSPPNNDAGVAVAASHPTRQAAARLDALEQSVAVELAMYSQFLDEDMQAILDEALVEDPAPEDPATTELLDDHDHDPLEHAAHGSDIFYPASVTTDLDTGAVLVGRSSSPENLETSPIAWRPLPEIQRVLDDRGLGAASCLRARGQLVAVGTFRGMVAVFGVQFELKCILSVAPKANEPMSAVTAVDLAESGLFVASGHDDGSVCLWNLAKASLVKKIAPLPDPPRDAPVPPPGGKGAKYGHHAGNRIVHLCFVGKSNRRVISVDELGVAFYHVVSLQLFNSVDTRRFFGSYENRLNRSKLTTVFALASYDRFVALVTPFKLVILDTRPVRTVYRALRMNTGAPELGRAASVTGCLTIVGNTLVATWTNWVRVLRLSVVEDRLTYRTEHEGMLPHPVLVVRPLDARYLAFLTDAKQIDFFSLDRRAVVEATDAPHLVGLDDRLDVTHNLGDRGELNYAPALEAWQGALLTVGDQGVTSGTLVPATERLMAMALAGDCAATTHFALDLVHGAGNSYVHALASVPTPPTLTDLVCGAALQCLRSTGDPDTAVPQLMQLLAVIPACEPYLYAQFYDAARDAGLQPVFFAHLLGLIRGRDAASLAPHVVDDLLRFLRDTGRTDEYAAVLRLVPPQLVDLDAAFRACEELELTAPLLHLYAVMGQLAAGLDAVAVKDALAFVRDALGPAGAGVHGPSDRSAMVAWVLDHLPALLTLEDTPAEIVVDAVDRTLLHLRDRAALVDRLRDIRDAARDLGAEGQQQHALVAFACVLLAAAAKRFPNEAALSSAEMHALLSLIVTTYTHEDEDEGAVSVAGLWPPVALTQSAVAHLVDSLTLSPDQTAALEATCEDLGWWAVCEHMARAAVPRDTARLVECAVRDPARKPADRFAALHAVLAPLAASALASPPPGEDGEERWDPATTTAVTQRFLAALAPLCAIDPFETARLVVARAPHLYAAAHDALAGTPLQPAFRMALAETASGVPVPPALLRQCLEDLAAAPAGADDGDSEPATFRFVSRHFRQAPRDDWPAWLAVCQTHRRVCAASVLLEALGRTDEALDVLLGGSTDAQHPDHLAMAVALCRCAASEPLWVRLVGALLATGHGNDAALREALLAMRAIPSVLARLVRDHSGPVPRALLAGLATAVRAHHAHADFTAALARVARSERRDLAATVLADTRRGFAVAFPAAACAACGAAIDTGGPLHAWPCAHAAHAACSAQVGGGAAARCPVCHPARVAGAHTREVMGKSPAGGRGKRRAVAALVTGSAGAGMGGGMLLSPIIGSPRPMTPVTPGMRTPGTPAVAMSAAAAAAGGAVGVERRDEGAPQFVRPRRNDWHAMLSTMIQRHEDDDDD
ncbi:hypothetical protein H9P43_005487 [Blastocladiella emersonii ATCC 22665]|nr:hypothetical protein H9P43_005487 [Blastocladiella emersonii ATCC 22665]